MDVSKLIIIIIIIIMINNDDMEKFQKDLDRLGSGRLKMR